MALGGADRKNEGGRVWRQWEMLRAWFFAAEPAAAGGWALLRRPKVGLRAGSEQRCFMCPDAGSSSKRKEASPQVSLGAFHISPKLFILKSFSLQMVPS